MRIGLIISVLFLMACTEQEATKSKDDVNVSLINNPVTLDDTDSTQMPKIQFEEDFYTLEKCSEISFNQFFSFKDNNNFVYGFDIVSIYNLAFFKILMNFKLYSMIYFDL